MDANGLRKTLSPFLLATDRWCYDLSVDGVDDVDSELDADSDDFDEPFRESLMYQPEPLKTMPVG
jgi:hypothetical protein